MTPFHPKLHPMLPNTQVNIKQAAPMDSAEQNHILRSPWALRDSLLAAVSIQHQPSRNKGNETENGCKLSPGRRAHLHAPTSGPASTSEA